MNAKQVAGRIRSTSLATTLAIMLSAPSHADDIDVYLAQAAANQKPNILFVLDYSGSMSYNVNGGYTSSTYPAKITILKDAMRQVLNQNINRINAGIGSLYSYSTTGIRWPISELSADANSIDPAIPTGRFTVKDIVQKQVEARGAGGNTATVDALVEAAQYFRGDPVTHNDGVVSPTDTSRSYQPNQWNTGSANYTGGNSSAAIAATYSPSNAYNSNTSATYYCNDYSTSGGPNYCENKLTRSCEARSRDDDATEGFERLENLWGSYRRCQYRRTSAWVGARYNSPIARSCQSNAIVLISDGQPTAINDGASLRSIVGTNLNGCEDLSSRIFNKPRNSKTYGNCGPEVLRALSEHDQNPAIAESHVITYTIGFGIDGPGQAYLSLLAQAGQGSYFKADKPEELTDALTTIVDKVLSGSENFTPMSVDVDKANFSHDNRAFFNLFTPSVRRGWSGNLKGYFLDTNGLMDINAQPATEEIDGGQQFSENAQSFWSSGKDGNDVTLGGANEQIISGTRTLYTYTGNSIPTNGVTLSGSPNNRLSTSNNTITTELMGLPSGSTQRQSALNWIQTASMGDPLHSKIVSVNYANQRVVYAMTNQGLLHAIDATHPTDPTASDSSGGNELFAFMPKRLLKNLPDLAANANTGSHIYGLDGALTRWHSDDNNDGIVNESERVLLIMGMRRGGNAYIALDVSSPTSPRLAWVIDSDNPDFSALAQSWSRMSLITVNNRGTDKKVLAFAAGYDATVLDGSATPVQSLGNAIYMVDDHGSLVWSATSAEHASMQYSIASDLAIIDSDRDGLADRLYVGDIAGQLWRVDFEDIRNTPDVTLFANLADNHHQPFFYPPSIAMNKQASGNFLSISIGSGNRTNPLLTNTNNNIYMLKDPNLAKGPPASRWETITHSALYDATANDISSSNSMVAKNAQDSLNTASGWKVALSSDEKSLSSLVTFEGKLMATTFEANTSNSQNICSFSSTGRFYSMDIFTAQPIDESNLFESTSADSTLSRARQLKSSGIPSSPMVTFPKGSGTAQIVVDKETVSEADQSLSRIFWHAK